MKLEDYAKRRKYLDKLSEQQRIQYTLDKYENKSRVIRIHYGRKESYFMS